MKETTIVMPPRFKRYRNRITGTVVEVVANTTSEKTGEKMISCRDVTACRVRALNATDFLKNYEEIK